jgi:hypothetical protein
VRLSHLFSQVDLLNQSVETSCCSESKKTAPNFKSACTSIPSSFVSAIRKKRDDLFNVKKAKRCRRGGRNWIAFGDDIPYRYFEDDVLYNGTQTTAHNEEECNSNTWDESYRQFALELALESSSTDEDGSINRDSRTKLVILDVGIPFAVDDNTLSSPSSVDIDFSSNAHASPSKKKSQSQNLNDDDDTILNLCCGQNAWWKPATISHAFRYVRTLATYDKETRSILKLAIPYSFSAVMDAIFEAIGIGIVGHYLGTDALIAYSVVDVIISISSELVGGVIDTEASLCSHAIGAGNNMLAGQYVQLAVIIYCVCQIPFIFLWSFGMERILLEMDFDEHIAVMGQEYARVAIWADLYEGIVEAYEGLLEVAGYEQYIAFIGLIEGVIEILLLFILVRSFDVTLVHLAYLSIGVGVLFFIINVGFTTYKKWTRPYMHGMIGTVALKNRTALRVMIKTAAPLSVGALLANGEVRRIFRTLAG